MKLKPSLLKLIVALMTISLLASCASTPETSQDCNRVQTAQGELNQKAPECQPNSASGSSGNTSSRSYYGGYSGSRYGSGASDGGSSSSRTSVGRSGFGSFGRGGHGGG